MIQKILLSFFFLSVSFFSFSQRSTKAYAITGQASGNFNWTDIREVDLSTGKFSSTIFESGKTKFSFQPPSEKNKAQVINPLAMPTESMVAAAAFDKKHNKLFFTPMKIGELRWLDLSSVGEPKFFSAETPLQTTNLNDEANQLTRMVIGADGNGYAITNDANHLIKFTTGKKTEITDLGSILDAPSNNSVSIHNKCSSWGGDLVADAYGKLYLFAAPQNVFVIDIQKRMATYLGNVKNLSGTFTVNGAAADEEDNVIISSANSFEGFYKVSIKDLTATKVAATGQVFNASDLAGCNLLFENKLRNEVGTASLLQQETLGNSVVSIYPNPVTANQFKVTFDKAEAGKYNIAISDLQGKIIMNGIVNVKFAKQTEAVQWKLRPAGGMYFIKVTNASKASVYTDKFVIQ